MIKDTYLSIDMDFWCKTRGFEKVVKFFDRLKSNNIIPTVVKYHHELAIHASSISGITRLINMDYHSDIADVSVCSQSDFNEGTWVNYVRLDSNDEYVWYYPSTQCVNYDTGYCHAHAKMNPFTKKQQSKYHWNRVLKTHGEIPDWEFDRIASVGICMSPNWTHTKHLYFMYLLKHHGYLTNDMLEHMVRIDDPESVNEIEYNKLNKKFLYYKMR